MQAGELNPIEIKIGRSIRKIVRQNIVLDSVLKLPLRCAFAIVEMRETVFADVGVEFSAILYSTYLQRMNWK